MSDGGCTLDEFLALLEERKKRERWYKPGFWMIRNLKFYIKDLRQEVKFAFQRVFRGWDDRAVWSICDRLSETLGDQLIMMSEVAHGFPPEYPEEVPSGPQFLSDDKVDATFTLWKADLRKHGEALKLFHEKADDLTGDAWLAVYRPAQEALHWAADHFADLWD